MGLSSQAIEMVEGTYSNGDTGPNGNPFGFDSFGNSLAGPGQQSQRPPRSQQPPRLSLVGLPALMACFAGSTGTRRCSQSAGERSEPGVLYGCG